MKIDKYEFEAEQIAGGLQAHMRNITKADDSPGAAQLGAVKFAARECATMILERGDIEDRDEIITEMFLCELRLALLGRVGATLQ